MAETLVDAEFDSAGNKAFKRLFNYISHIPHKLKFP
ncbi:MAG: hypothetical protein IPM78_11890 [Moraxellaceae bacterium]|nr:hypothetical protein [Moraxellaceae bacterium]